MGDVVSLVSLLGWAGSALLIFSLLQARVLRLRALNLLASIILIIFNALVQVWPMVAMNVATAAINVFYLNRLLRDHGRESTYTVLEVDGDDVYLHHFLEVERAQIAKYFPQFRVLPSGSGRRGFLILKGNETIGVMVVGDAGNGTAEVALDYVTERYRDFGPGEFVYRRSGLFTDNGWHRVLTPSGMVAPYYEKLGFTRLDDRYVLELAPPAGTAASAGTPPA